MIIAERETSGATRRAVLLVVLLRKVQGIMSSMGIMGESEFALEHLILFRLTAVYEFILMFFQTKDDTNVKHFQFRSLQLSAAYGGDCSNNFCK